MKIHPILLSVFFLSVFYSNYSTATIHTAIASDDWDKTSTWDQGSIPTATDTVVIDGYSVKIDINTGNVNVKRIVLINATNINNSELIIDGAVTVTIDDDFSATLLDIDKGIELNIMNGATLNVGGKVDFIRVATNSYSKNLLLNLLGASRMNVSGTFNFDYKNGDPSEGFNEIYLDNTAILDVTGNATLYLRGGNDFYFQLLSYSQAIFRADLNIQMSGGDEMNILSKDHSHFQVAGNVNITNSGGNKHVILSADGSHGKFTISGNLVMNSTVSDKAIFVNVNKSNSVLNVLGDVSMSATSEDDVYIELKDNSNFYLGGDFLRPTNFGALLMSLGSTLTYNGTETQTFTDEDISGSGTDAFNFTNIVFNNPSGFILTDTLVIQNNLDLTLGKIVTDDNNIIIIEDSATITGGDQNTFIDGPIIKRGRSISDFVFPVGSGEVYAPIEVSQIYDKNAEFIAQYRDDPPPFGNNIADTLIAHISSHQYWTLSKTENVNVILHWSSSSNSEIMELTDLLVVGLDEDSEKWNSLGNIGTTGDTDSGSLRGDPPPFGMEKFTIGSIAKLDVLPVELIRFHAKQQNNNVDVVWSTASEINTSHFVVERSVDGINFAPLKNVMSQGAENEFKFYTIKDNLPYKGINYYRLKIMDIDGSFEYSNIEVVKYEVGILLNIYPNPVKQILKLKLSESITEESTIEAFDRKGQRVFIGTILIENGRAEVNTDSINVLSPGNYFLRITGNSNTQVLKFIKIEN